MADGASGPAFALFVSILMVVTGSLNTICAKSVFFLVEEIGNGSFRWADSIKPPGENEKFNHPFLQVNM